MGVSLQKGWKKSMAKKKEVAPLSSLKTKSPRLHPHTGKPTKHIYSKAARTLPWVPESEFFITDRERRETKREKRK